MKRFGLTKKAVLKSVVCWSIVILVSQLLYMAAERVGVSWLWFSNRWLFNILFGFVLSFAAIAAKHLGVTWLDFLYMGMENSVVPWALFWKRVAVCCIVFLCLVCAFVAAQAFLCDKEQMLGLVCIESCFRQW
ncbi:MULTISPECIES: hypothetical protein [unclassified Bartonella]|uniref:hypothetical protein n=1 Tax=unclassified Bartonella TaxID=2645622 RepID=UPI0020C363E7|nr:MULTISPECIES: hypothetical protein [unclassified Bartonella]